MAEFYQDKSEEKIKNDVSEQFKKDDGITRDDYEIYGAAIKVINSYIKEIGDSKKESRGPRAIKEFTDLKNQLSKEKNNMTGRKFLTENQKVIQDIANRIDNAEKLVLEKLVLNRANAKTINAINSSEKIQNKKYFNRDGSGILTFSSEVNKPTINEVLGNVFKNNTDVYKIDYSGCTNQNIKNKMASLSGGRNLFYISYDQEKKTYLLTDSSGNKLDQRALIREGVKLTPGGVIAYQAKQESKKSIEEKNKKIDEQSNIANKTIDQLKVDPKRGAIINLIPPSLKSELEKDISVYKDFLSKTEKRLDEVIKDAKSKNRELHTEPISKVYGSGLMEVHMISGTAEKDLKLWNDESHLGNAKLYDILDGEESGYKSYLTSRIQHKRSEYDYLTKKENVVSTNKEVKKENLASVEEKTNAIYGIGLMGKLIDNLRENEGNTRANNDDRKITDIIKYIRNAQYSIQTNENISKSDLNAISIKLKDLYNAYKNIDEKYFASLISGPKDKSIEAIRKIGEGLTTFDNTHTTFLRDEIVENDNLEIKESIYNNCFQKIGEMLAIPEGDGEMPANIKANIDALYLNSANPQSVLNFLKSKGMLPSFATLDDEKIKEGCDKIYNTIQNKNQIINNFNITAEDMKGSLQEEKINLESKDNKTSDDIARLNAILFLLDNPDALQEQATNQTKVMKDVTKYAGIDSEIKGAIGSRLIKQGGGVSGTNADIYNDSIGAGGWFERSDENVSKTSEILEQIAIEVAICIVAIAAGALTFGAGTAAIYGARAAMIAARVVSAASKGGKILKIMKLASRFANYKKYYKAGKAISKALEVSAKARKVEQIALATNKITKIGKIINPFVYGTELGKGIQTLARGTALVLEGTTFHLSSTVLHNAVNGKMDLFEGTDPTGYMVLPDGTQMPNRKSYTQSIAFLGVLKAVGQPVQQLTKALLAKIMSQKATASMMGKAVQSMGSFTGEVGTLMGTEQVLSLTFDQKLSPLTWEGFIHTIGMVAGLRGYGYTKLKLMNYISNTKSKSLTLEGEKNGKKGDIIVKENGDITFKENLPTTLKIEASHMKAGAKLEGFKAGDKIKYGEKEYELKNNEVKEYKSSKNKYLEAKDSKGNDVELMLLEGKLIEFISRPTTGEVNNLPTTLKIEASHMKAGVKLEGFKAGDKIKYGEKEYELFDIEVKEYKTSKNKYLEAKDSNGNIVELQLLEGKLIEFISRTTTGEVNNLPTRQEIKQESIKTPEEQIQEIRDNPQMEDIIILNERLDSPQNKNRLEKLVIDINNDPSIPQRINRERFVLGSKGEKFNYENWKLLDKLETTSIRNGDVVVSRKGEKFEITVKDGKAFLVNKSDISKEVEFTESMINNYKIVKRYATGNETRGVGYYTTKTLDFLQGWPIVGLSIKYPRKFIKLGENTIKEFQSFFREATNPDITKINEYNYIFRRETLGNNPQNIVKIKQNLKAGAKTVLNVSTPSSPEFSSMNRRTLKDIRRTGVKDGDLIVDKNGNEFVSEIRGKDVVLKDIKLDKLGNESIMRIGDIADYRVVRREGARNLWYINGRIVDNIANNVPLAKYPIWATRGAKNESNKWFGKNKFKENKQENALNQQPENQVNNQDNINETNKQINYLENQLFEMQKQFDSKKNKSPDDIKTFEQNMDAYNQKIEVLKAEDKLKKEAEAKLKKEAEAKLKKEAEVKLKEETNKPTEKTVKESRANKEIILGNNKIKLKDGEIQNNGLEIAKLPKDIVDKYIGKDADGKDIKVYINNPKLEGTLLSKDGVSVFRGMQGRMFVMAKVGDFRLPFYISSAGTSGKIAGERYPFFGYTGRWLVKGSVGPGGEMVYSKKISEVQKLLNDNLKLPDRYIDHYGKITDGAEHLYLDMNSVIKYDKYSDGNEADRVADKTGFHPDGVRNDGLGSADRWIKDIIDLVENKNISFENLYKQIDKAGSFIADNNQKYSQGKEVLKAEYNFENVQSFEELYKAIDKLGDFKIGEYTPQQIKNGIDNFRKSGDMRFLNLIPTDGGLKNIVENLLKLEIGIKSKKALSIEESELKRYKQSPKLDSQDYMERSLNSRKYFQERLMSIDKITPDNFVKMMKELHMISAYKGSNIANIGEIRTSEVKGGVRPRADTYADMICDKLGLGPAQNLGRGAQTPYASIKEFPEIFKRCSDTLQKIKDITKDNPGKNNEELQNLLADYYKDMLYARPFGNVNNSLFMNQINFFLKANGINSVTHGHLDHIATRTSKNQFRVIFRENIKNELPLANQELIQDLNLDNNSDIVINNNKKWSSLGKVKNPV